MWFKRKLVMIPFDVSKRYNCTEGLIVKCIKSWTPIGNSHREVNKLIISRNWSKGVLDYYEAQHLYITSDEEIKGGDYRLENNHTYNTPDSATARWANENNCKKIIATTDTSLRLPQPSQQFIEKYIEEYNKGNVISEVEVEYLLFLEPGNTLNDRKYDKTILKVNSDNTINIKSAKNSWTRDEVIELLHKSLDANIVFNDKFNKIFHEQLDEWIKENL